MAKVIDYSVASPNGDVAKWDSSGALVGQDGYSSPSRYAEDIATPSGLPTAADSGIAGNLTGTYYYTVTFVAGTKETAITTAVPTPVTVTAKKVNLTAIPVSSDSRVTARKIYRNVASDGDANRFVRQWLVGTISDNTTTTYTDNVADGSLGAAAPRISDFGPIAYFNGTRIAAFGGRNTVAIGYNNHPNRTGYACTSLGDNALAANTIGERNVGVGVYALTANTTGARNTAAGTHALNSSVTGDDSTAFGYGAGYSFTSTGSNNTITAVGSYAAYNTTAAGCVAVGYRALMTNASGANNTAIGDSAARLATGTGVTAVGKLAGEQQTGNFNTSIGQQALTASGSGTGNSALGYTAGKSATGSNALFLGFRAGEYDTAGNVVYIDTLNRTDLAGGKANSLIYGTVNASGAAAQQIWLNGAVTTLKTTVASLPSAATVGAGARAFVTDANATTFASTVAGGGANNVPVYSDGTNWKIG